MSRKAMQVALEALESDPISHAGPVTVLSPGKGTGCGYTNINENWTPLYTAPPKKEWVGLTDEEVYQCEQLAAIRYQRHKYSVRGQIITPADGLEWHFAQAIEAKLKEKNT